MAVNHVTVATKARSVSSDYVFYRWGNQVKKDDETPVIIYYGRDADFIKEKQVVDASYWDAYYRGFSEAKPSSGLCAVFAAVELWAPDRIGLIGFEYVLDGYEEWQKHDSNAEKKAISSLVEIIDLRENSG